MIAYQSLGHPPLTTFASASKDLLRVIALFSYFPFVKLRKLQPLVNYSAYIQQEEVSYNPQAEVSVQRYLNSFFELRDSQELRIRNLAQRLLMEKKIVENVSGIEICYQINQRKFEYTFSPNFKDSIYCPLVHQGLGWSKRSNLNILTDAIAECETLATLGYAAH